VPNARCRSLLLARIAGIAGCAALVGAAQAAENTAVGPRALGMGGAGVAVTDGAASQHHNPAVFGFFAYGRERAADAAVADPVAPATPESDPQAAPAAPAADPASPPEPAAMPAPVDEPITATTERFASDNNDLLRKDWGVHVDAHIGYRSHEQFVAYIDQIDQVDFDALTGSAITASTSLRDLTKLGNAFVNIDDPGNAMTLDGTGGAAVRIWRFGLGVRGFGETAARVDEIDLVNVGLPSTLATPTFASAVNASGDPEDNQILLLDPGLVAAFGGGAAATNAVERLDFAARQEGVTASEAQELSLLYAAMNAQYGTANQFEDNTTAITLRSVSVAEVPLTYGHPLSEHLSVGGSVKLMIGKVYGTQVRVFDEDLEDALKSADDDYEQTVNVGIDLGVMARMPMFQVGLTARNINAPKFDGPTIDGRAYDDWTVDPQVTLGLGFIPWTWLTVALDCDLIATDTILDGYESQRLGAGIEIEPWRFIALRAGLSDNIAESSDDFLVHAGLGVNLWAVRIDVAGAMSLETVEVDDEESPTEARASLGVSVDF